MCICFSVNWDFTGTDGIKKAITRSFYRAQYSDYAEEHFQTGHIALLYDSTVATNVFPLEINGMLLGRVRCYDDTVPWCL